MANEDRLKKIEQEQKDLQAVIAKRVEDQLVKVQQDMREQLAKAQDDMLGKLAQMLRGKLPEPGEASVVNPVIDPTEGNEYPAYPLGFIPTHAKLQQSPQIVISRGKTPFDQDNPSVPINAPSASKNLLGDHQAENFVLEMDHLAEAEKSKVETSNEIAERCKRLEEKLQAMEMIDTFGGIDASELSLVPDLVLPPKFKVPEFEKYDGTSCPRAHLTMFCRKMTGYGKDDKLLIHCFQDSLTGSVSRWYNQLTRPQIKSWKDLAKVFLEQYKHISDMVPDRLTLQHMKQQSNESIRQYAQRWRDVAAQVQPPLSEKETVVIFIQTLEGPILDRLIGNATTNFADLVLSGELIESAIKSGKIDVGGSSSHKKPHYGRKDNEVNFYGVNNTSYSNPVTVVHHKNSSNTQGSSNQESGQRRNYEKQEFTPLPMSYGDLYKELLKAHIVVPFHQAPTQPPFPKWYNPNASCEYHAGQVGHTIENCFGFKRLVEKYIKLGIISFENPAEPSTIGNPLPRHEGSS